MKKRKSVVKANICNLLAGWLLVLIGLAYIGLGVYIISQGALVLMGFAFIPIILGIFPLIVGIFVIKNKSWAKIIGIVISVLSLFTIIGNLFSMYSQIQKQFCLL